VGTVPGTGAVRLDDAQRLEYLPLAHPELPLEDGFLLVSLNHNNIDLNVVPSNPAAFRPTFHAVQNLS
jgi:hypothetical protein